MLANGGELHGVRVHRPDTVKTLITNQLTCTTFPVRFETEWSGMGYGLGIGVDVADRQQIGWVGISGTTAWIYPSEKMIAIAMPQALFHSEASNAFIQIAIEAIVD